MIGLISLMTELMGSSCETSGSVNPEVPATNVLERASAVMTGPTSLVIEIVVRSWEAVGSVDPEVPATNGLERASAGVNDGCWVARINTCTFE